MNQRQALLHAQELQLLASARLEPVLFHGKSMEPFFLDGDELWAEAVAWEEIRPGDIITYRLTDQFPTCRVMEKKGSHLLLSTDNWRWAHFEAWQEDVLGRIVARRRDGRILRHTDPEWTQTAQQLVLRYRARKLAKYVRARAGRVPFRLRERWLSWQTRYSELPYNIQVNVSSRCNLRCRMCPYLEIHKNPNVQHYMSRETFEKLLPVIRNTKAVAFVGAGEPLFNKDLVHFMELTRKASPDAQIEVTTNATMLTPHWAQALIRLRVHKVHLSFDGLNPETVESIRRGVRSSQVLQNIQRLAELKKEKESFFPILMINYMVGYGTYRELVDFIPLARELGVKEIQMLEIQPATADDYADNLFNNLKLDQGRLLRQALKRASHAGIQLHLPGVRPNSCTHPYIPHIGEDGEVYPCCYLDYDGRQLYYQGKEVKLPAVSFGNINRTNFREIWNSPAYRALRARNLVGDFPDHCRTCYNVRAETAEKVKQVLGPR